MARRSLVTVFRVYALSSVLTLGAGASPPAFASAIAGRVIGEAQLIALYEH